RPAVAVPCRWPGQLPVDFRRPLDPRPVPPLGLAAAGGWRRRLAGGCVPHRQLPRGGGDAGRAGAGWGLAPGRTHAVLSATCTRTVRDGTAEVHEAVQW